MVYNIYHIGYMYNNTGFPYSDMGTEYGQPRYLLNKKIK